MADSNHLNSGRIMNQDSGIHVRLTQAEEPLATVRRHGDTVAALLQEGCRVGGSPWAGGGCGGFDGPTNVLARPIDENCRFDD
jgi:hypothetical protein